MDAQSDVFLSRINIFLSQNGQLMASASTTTTMWGPIGVAVDTETWYHVTITWSATSGLTIYLNGISGAALSASVARAQVRINPHVTAELAVRIHIDVGEKRNL